ncbi:TetR/AcrR family transcriptional regulator [Ramlibacter rhizophilus]|uniref:TetR/AcrR family transcriptional regulator n=1 Tax=Ramlibacter rhizophilus TaxID=1781167 RepID=A0A4Z0BDV6_9BURK|nr:TetR/AcrR family transcriptional regulator [Ramlibacter rhizophilus]TFY96559.1 TetR/AcrR family transcriptional regulator [Ramlibacter rhizophilus]
MPATPSEATAGRRVRHKHARPGQLIEAALALFVEKGYAATRVEEIAQRAGVSKGTLFVYFQSKEDLFQAVVRENIAGRFVEWNEEFHAFQGSSADMLRYCMRSWWERIGATPASGITKLMLCEAQNFPEALAYYQQQVIAPGKDLIRRILERGIARGEFQVPDLDCAVYAVIAPMIFLLLNKHSLAACLPESESIDPLRYVDAQAEVLLSGLRAPEGPARQRS